MFLTFIYDVNAAEFSTRAIVTTGTEYDSNPSLAENNKNPVWVYTITPQFQLDASNELNINYSTAKTILRVHRLKRRILRVNKEKKFEIFKVHNDKNINQERSRRKIVPSTTIC